MSIEEIKLCLLLPLQNSTKLHGHAIEIHQFFKNHPNQACFRYANSSFIILKTFLSLEIVLSIIELCLSITCASLCTKTCFYYDQPLICVHNYPVIPVRVFSSIQILVGIASLLFFFILFTLSFDMRHTLTFEEVYCGFVFIGIGTFGFYTIKKVSLTSLTPFMVLNVFGVLFAGLLLALAAVRIYMLDKVQERYVNLKQEDLVHFPRLNCTKDVLESLNQMQLHHRQQPLTKEEIQINIRNCEQMKHDAIVEADKIFLSQSEYAGPRKIFQLEIALALFESVAAMACAFFCCRSLILKTVLLSKQVPKLQSLISNCFVITTNSHDFFGID